MLLDLPPNFVLQEVTPSDMNVASIAWGFTLGFGFLTTWSAIKQTRRTHQKHGFNKLHSPYIWMIWLEIGVSLAFSIICWLHLEGIIAPSFAFYFTILTLWALQVQFLLQIIINRVMILMTNRRTGRQIRLWTAVFITGINISVYCIWVPARMQISDEYIHINNWWDRCEKIIYLLVDAALNILFIRIVQQNLVENGLKKYSALVKFNAYIIVFSLSMDVLIVATMSLKNTFVYMQFHPLAYIVKLKIEMSMADLIARVARSKDSANPEAKSSSRPTFSLGTSGKPNANTQASVIELRDVSKRNSKQHGHDPNSSHCYSNTATATERGWGADTTRERNGRDRMEIWATNEVSIAYGQRSGATTNAAGSFEDAGSQLKQDDDEAPLKEQLEYGGHGGSVRL